MRSPTLALDAALDAAALDENDEGEASLAPPLAALDAVGGHKTISFFGASRAWRAHCAAGCPLRL